MALTIRMRIDDNDEHQYYYATGSGTEIELIPLVVDSNGDYVPDEGKAYNRVTVNVPSTELETLIVNTNGTYNAPDGKAYNVVQVDVKSIINLQNKSASYTANGNYNIQADSGYDGLGTVSVAVNVPTGGGGDSNDFIPSSGFRSVTPLNFNQNKLRTAYVGRVITFTTNDTISVGDKVIIEGDLMSGSDKKHHYAVWGTVTAYNATSTLTKISVEGSSVRFYSQSKMDFTDNTSDDGVLGFTSIDVNVHPGPFEPVDPDDPYNFGDGMVEVDESQMSSLLTDPTNTRLYYRGDGEHVSSGDKIWFQDCEVKTNGETIGTITIWGTFGACDPDDDQPYFVFATVDGYTYQPTTGDPITKLAHPCSVTNGEQIVEYV